MKKKIEYANPVCPVCGEEMIRAHEENEEGDWGIRWLCGCKSTQEERDESEVPA